MTTLSDEVKEQLIADINIGNDIYLPYRDSSKEKRWALKLKIAIHYNNA